ncbi:nitroreductase family protein [Miniphocaeibacter halophilus]|uniref:Nitroreductase family protein n=1 Tax=Miniphocaeibacter halophilus TaxID=2931922 RepID=A0AC61MRV1_9FIRM|nr:nitroreductase family protein [Miniphocaeibacter halophilus]QQK07320.1 nitroreductase family protein [Miniphocaeibacter halophilus]
MNSNLLEIERKRRSIYKLGKNLPISEDEIINLISDIVKNAPSAYNSQTGKISILLNENHNDLWNIVENTLKKKMGPDRDFSKTKAKIDGFKAAYGTILYFENKNKVKELQETFSSYADKFPQYSQHSSAILQILIWLGLAEQNIGANLQHYNPIIDNEIKAKWDIPKEFELVAQMPFGEILSPAGEKEFDNIDNRIKIFR